MRPELLEWGLLLTMSMRTRYILLYSAVEIEEKKITPYTSKILFRVNYPYSTTLYKYILFFYSETIIKRVAFKKKKNNS